MTGPRETPRILRSPKWWMGISFVCLIFSAGCNPPVGDDSDIEALERSWPEYRAPHLDASADMNIWPNQMSEAQRMRRARGSRPIIDRPMHVIRAHQDWTLEETAVDSLARIGEPAVSELIKALRSTDPKIRFQAAQVLGRIGPSADASVSALVASMKDPTPEVRRAAARALGQIGSDSPEAVRSLMDVIRSSGGSVISHSTEGETRPGELRPSLGP